MAHGPGLRELGVDPMSIYNHIKGKAALLDAISEAVLTEVTAASADWPARLDGHRAGHGARIPRDGGTPSAVFPLLATRAQTSAIALEAVERLTAAMSRAELADQTVADALVLFGFLNGYLLATLSTEPGGGRAGIGRRPTGLRSCSVSDPRAPRSVAGEVRRRRRVRIAGAITRHRRNRVEPALTHWLTTSGHVRSVPAQRHTTYSSRGRQSTSGCVAWQTGRAGARAVSRDSQGPLDVL